MEPIRRFLELTTSPTAAEGPYSVRTIVSPTARLSTAAVPVNRPGFERAHTTRPCAVRVWTHLARKHALGKPASTVGLPALCLAGRPALVFLATNVAPRF